MFISDSGDFYKKKFDFLKRDYQNIDPLGTDGFPRASKKNDDDDILKKIYIGINPPWEDELSEIDIKDIEGFEGLGEIKNPLGTGEFLKASKKPKFDPKWLK